MKMTGLQTVERNHDSLTIRPGCEGTSFNITATVATLGRPVLNTEKSGLTQALAPEDQFSQS